MKSTDDPMLRGSGGAGLGPAPRADATQGGALPLRLTGVRALDLGHVFQGPYAAFLMAMAGAEIIKVESPTGDMMRKRARDGDYPFRVSRERLNG